MPAEPAEPAERSRPAACPACGTRVPSALLACPGCRRLVFADELKALAARAEVLEREARLGEAIGTWRDALRLLPADSPQALQVGERIEDLLSRPEAARDPQLRRRAEGGRWQGLAGMGLIALLVAGLTKLPMLAGIAAMFGVLWTAFGWKLAAGVLVSLYIHELGHVLAMWRRGLPVTAPMFVPGLGAYVRMSERPATPVEDNRIGLAGPLAGLAAALAAWGLGEALGAGSLVATAGIGAILNLFNLIPIWQLDGARGFASLTRNQRFAVTAAFGIALALSGQKLLLLPLVVAAAVSVGGRPAPRADGRGLAIFVFLIAALSAVAALAAPPLG